MAVFPTPTTTHTPSRCTTKSTARFAVVAREYDPKVGNGRLMDIVSGDDRLNPVWVLLPETTGEMGVIEDVLREMIEEKVTMARVFPMDHNFSFTEWGCGSTLSAIERAGIPLMIDLDQTSYDQVSAVCSSHPELKLILSDVAYRADRFIYPLLDLHPNLFIETARYQTHRGIEAICQRFGPTRLVFGSRVPDLACGPMAMTIRYAKIGAEEKEQILGRNLARLMEGIGW